MTNEKKKLSNLTKVLIGIVILLIGYLGYRNNMSFKEEDFGVERDHPLLKAFEEEYPTKEVVKCGLGDVTGNGLDDLIVIFRHTEHGNHMVVCMDRGDGKVEFTDESPAPYENQTIEIKDIDNEPPNEFIVSGSKRGQYGYGIFRIEDDHIHNLFSEGMDLC